ncbi:MAG: hypothetical protein ACP5NP_03165 [Acetobacteraceae bacterium]
MTKLSCSEKEWGSIRPASVKETGLSASIRAALKALPGSDTDKLASFDACDTAVRLLNDLVLDLGKVQSLVEKAKDDKKDAAKTLKAWAKEADEAKEAASARKLALVTSVTEPVLARWTGPRKELESKVQNLTSSIREADNDLGHSEQLREECVIGMVKRAGELQEEGDPGKVPEDFLKDSEFKAAYELWQDQIEITVSRTKELETAKSQQQQIKKLIATMQKEVSEASDQVKDGLSNKDPAIKKFVAFRDDVKGFFIETCTDNAKKYHVFAMIPDFEASGEVAKSEQKRLLTRFAKMKKVDAEAYLESKLATYGLNEKRLKKALQSVTGANREIEGIVAGLEKGDAKDPKADAKQLKELAGQIDQTNKTYIKARANQEVAQALSRPENAKYAETVKAALAFFQTSADEAAVAAKKYA